MNYDELMRYKPAQTNFDPEFASTTTQVAQVPGLGTVSFMPDGRIVLNDPNSPSGETWLTKGSNGEVVGAPQAKGDTSFMGAIKDLLPAAAVGLGGPLLGGYLQGLGGVSSGVASYAAPEAVGGWSSLGGSGITDEMLLTGQSGLGGLGVGEGVNAGWLAGIDSTAALGGAAAGAATNAGSTLSSLAAPATAAKTIADLSKPVSEWGADDWLSAIGRAAPGLIGAVASSEQGSALSDLAKQQQDAETARYQDLVSRENARFAELKAREDAAIQRQNEYMKLGMSREDARFAELKEREDAAIARQNEFMKLGMSREDARFAELKQRENEAIARQRGDIEYGRAQTQPYRTKLSDLYANPDSFLNSNEVRKPVQMGSDILARSLSVGGNPIGSGNALQQLQSYSADQLFSRLGEEKNRLAQFGGLSAFGQSGATIPGIGSSLTGSTTTPIPGTGSGLPSGTNTSIPGIGSSLPGSANAGSNIGTDAGSRLSLASLESGNNVWNALGSAANNIFMPQKSLAQQLAELKQAGVF